MGINVRGVGHVVLKVRHDLAVLEVGANAVPAPADGVGLYHVALKIGDSLDDLRKARAHPNGLELFVDADPSIWRENPAAVAHVEPLEL
jgi:hypothetical protein